MMRWTDETAKLAAKQEPRKLTHKCPVRGCETDVDNSKLMCSRHWRRVKFATQREVYAAYKEQPLSRRHADAMAQAVREAGGVA